MENIKMKKIVHMDVCSFRAVFMKQLRSFNIYLSENDN